MKIITTPTPLHYDRMILKDRGKLAQYHPPSTVSLDLDTACQLARVQQDAGFRDPSSNTKSIEHWRGSGSLLLSPLKTGPFAAKVFRCRHPWLGEEVWREGIEVHGRAEGVRHQAR